MSRQLSSDQKVLIVRTVPNEISLQLTRSAASSLSNQMQTRSITAQLFSSRRQFAYSERFTFAFIIFGPIFRLYLSLSVSLFRTNLFVDQYLQSRTRFLMNS
jgi:hypothetical protein